MKKPTYITAMVNFKINDLAGVKKVISEWCIAEKASQGTLMYEFYFSEDNTHGTVIETFADDDGQQAHMINKDSLAMPNLEITEEFWNTTSSLLHRPYSFSKVMAEKEAWRLRKQQVRWDLVTINPTFVMGPGINPSGTSESFDIFRSFLNGDSRIGLPDYKIACVDVRDVAKAHVKAGFTPSASGRYLISGHNSGTIEIGAILKKLDPSLVIGKKTLPKWFLWLIAKRINSTRKEIATSIGYPFNVVNLKSMNDLNMEYLPLEKTISDWLCQLKES